MKGPRNEHAEAVALFRYGLVQEVLSPALSKAERGRIMRGLVNRFHAGPNGQFVQVSRSTIQRWTRAYRSGGFDALYPPQRRMEPETPWEILMLAKRLRVEDPSRTAAHIAELIKESRGWSPHPRTIQRFFKKIDLSRVAPTGQRAVFGRFEADRANELWVGDAVHGPAVAGRKTILFCFLDDHSRLVTGHRFAYEEDTLSALAALRRGILARGLPANAYLDNGSPFISRHFKRALAVLGVRLVHSRPGKPQGRGKVERLFRTVREQFFVEAAHSDIPTLDVLESRFAAWCEQVYHQRVHSETGQTPLDRFTAVKLPLPPSLARLHEAFLFSETRLVTKTATVSLYGNQYEVDPALAGKKVELLFDPFDLEKITVRYGGASFGLAVPHRIGRHSHPMAAKRAPEPVEPTGIDYLRLVETRQRARLGEPIGYRNLIARDLSPQQGEEEPPKEPNS